MWTIQQQALLRSEPPSCRVPELRRGHDFGAEQGSRSYCVRELGQGRRRLFQHLADDVSWTVTGSSPVAGTYTSRRDSSRGGHSTYRRAFVATDSAHGGEDHYGGKHGRRALGWSCGGEG